MKFRNSLWKELSNPLPGVEFQMKMAPKGRLQNDKIAGSKKEAAVSLILFEKPEINSIELILIKRAEYEGHHGGQVSFPGGKVDRTDLSLFNTAQRETFEEIGIILHSEYLLGKLTPLYIQVSGFLVQPFVFYLPSVPEFKLDKQEVSYIILCPIASLFDQSLVGLTQINREGIWGEAPFYAISGETVWGATSMIIAEFQEVLRRIKLKNRNLF
jgi:8-oxo-dGTP pyrophosphatase MutT (NUDIX family)